MTDFFKIIGGTMVRYKNKNGEIFTLDELKAIHEDKQASGYKGGLVKWISQEGLSFVAEDFVGIDFINCIETEEIRRGLGFPIKKELCYFKKDINGFTQYLIKSAKIKKVYPSWQIITIEYDEKVISIHSSYLLDMQSPTFVVDYEKLAKETAL